MSISGVSATSSASYIQQAQTTAATGLSAGIQGAPAQQADATQQSGKAHNHHHHGSAEDAAQSSSVTQSGTAVAGGTNILNTLV